MTREAENWMAKLYKEPDLKDMPDISKNYIECVTWMSGPNDNEDSKLTDSDIEHRKELLRRLDELLPDDEVWNEDDNYIDITLERMQCGWINLHFQGKGAGQDFDEILCFDEQLSDPMPAFIKSLSHLDMPGKFQWQHNHHYIFEFTTWEATDKYVQIIIKAHNYNGLFVDYPDKKREEYEPMFLYIDVTIKKQRYREIIDTLCKNILASPDYPYQYPMNGDGVEDRVLLCRLQDELSAINRNGKTDDEYKAQLDLIYKKYAAIKASKYVGYYNKYTTMLRDKIVPKEWFPQD